MKAHDSEVSSGEEATLSCKVTGLTKQLDNVTWRHSAGNDITVGQTETDFKIEQGEFKSDSNSQTTTLTIPASVNKVDAVYTCVVDSTEHGITGQATNVLSNVFSEYFTRSLEIFIIETG